MSSLDIFNKITYISEKNDNYAIQLRQRQDFEGWRKWEQTFIKCMDITTKQILNTKPEDLGNIPKGIYGTIEGQVPYFDEESKKVLIPDKKILYYWRTDEEIKKNEN